MKTKRQETQGRKEELSIEAMQSVCGGGWQEWARSRKISKRTQDILDDPIFD